MSFEKNNNECLHYHVDNWSDGIAVEMSKLDSLTLNLVNDGDVSWKADVNGTTISLDTGMQVLQNISSTIYLTPSNTSAISTGNVWH